MDTHELSCDVLVAGGGPAGVPCAVAAARCGAEVILLQDRPVLGGNASSEVRMHIVGADCSGGRGEALATEAREGGLVEEIRLETAARNPQRSASMLDLILYELCRAEPKLRLFLNTTVTGAEVTDQRITHALAQRQSTEDAYHIAARVFCDCTGDGRLGAEADAPFRRAREGRHEYDEPLAGEQADPYSLGSTLLFTARRHPTPMPFVAPPWARRFTEADLDFRPHASGGVDEGLEYGYWWCEWGGSLDTIKDNETIRDELLAILLGVWDHLKNGGEHGAEHWALEWFGFLPGKRESRRFIGQHVLSATDVLESRPQPDAIAYGGWPVDTHPPRGIDATEPPGQMTMPPHLYDVPLRSCISATVPNLMFAGRNLSATHLGFASTRVMATCAVIGQGVGTAAAEAVARGLDPADLRAQPDAVRAIQQRLLRDDCYLIGVTNDDPADLAREATVTASSAQPDGPPEAVLSGQTRAVHGPLGAPPDRARPGSHRWMSDPAAGLPAWIELRWPSPVTAGEVQLIFDTGLHRPLTLTQCDAYAAKMAWGRPQPEVVTDYRVEVETSAGWLLVEAVVGNWQRRRVHRFPATSIHAVRVVVAATGGLDHARVVEVRVSA